MISIGIILVLAGILILFGEISAFIDINNNFKCSNCKKVNKILHKKCSFCGAKMPKELQYKTMLFGKRNYKNSDGFIVKYKEITWVLFDIIICIIVTLVGICLIIK